MEKALKFLKRMKQTDTPYNFRECELDEAIADLEEAMKPKTCETCEHYSNGTQSDGFSWEKCDWYWECKRKYEDHYEPKATT